MSLSFERFATVSASTKRSPSRDVNKLVGLAVANIASLMCTPLDPLRGEIDFRPELEAPHELLQTFVDGDLDIVEGDILVVGSEEHLIRIADPWEWRGSSFLHLIIEQAKG